MVANRTGGTEAQINNNGSTLFGNRCMTLQETAVRGKFLGAVCRGLLVPRKQTPSYGRPMCGGRQVAIDVMKHAVISKFNDMRPGLYRELFKDVCEKARTGNSHTARRIVAFDPFAPAAFAVRIGITAWAALRETALKGAPGIYWKQVWGYGIAAWTALLIVKVLLGYGLQVSAARYLEHYERTHAGKGRNPVRAAPSRQEGKKVD